MNKKDTLVIIKNGKFYNSYNDHAIIMSYLFYNKKNDVYKKEYNDSNYVMYYLEYKF